MPENEKKRHTKADTDLRKTTGTRSAHERNKVEPDVEDLTDPEEVWKDAETTPSNDPTQKTGQGYRKRVADAGDVGGAHAPPYGTETQADALARQTERTKEPRDVEKPKRQ